MKSNFFLQKAYTNKHFVDAIQRIAKRHPKQFEQEIERLPDTCPYLDEINTLHSRISQ